MDLETILGSAVIAAIFSGLVSYVISRRQGNLQYITGERKEWREKVREIASKLDGASYKETLRILTELKVRINAFGNNEVSIRYSSDAHIWKLICQIETAKPSKEISVLKQKQLIEYLSLLLKVDWERSKKEVSGNIYDIASRGMFFLAGVYFSISIFICNVNTDIGKYDLVTMTGMYVFLIMFLNIPLKYEIEGTCKGILNGVITNNPKQYSMWKLTGCYLLCAVGVIVLIIGYLILIIQLFDFLGEGNPNELCIALLLILYAFGLGFQYVSQTINVDKEFYYVNAINKIRVNCGEKEKEIKIMAVVTKKDEKFKEVYETMTNKADIEEFRAKFEEKFPNEWGKINAEFNKEERKDKKGKGHPMPDPGQYLVNMYKVGVNKLK